MKTVIKSSLLICIFFVFSCSKDCTPPALDQNIVGTWAEIASFAGQILPGGDVIFKSDHTGNSPGEGFQASFNGGPKIKDFTWEIEGDTVLAIKYVDGSSYFTTNYQIVKNTCDKIKLNFIADIDLNRK